MDDFMTHKTFFSSMKRETHGHTPWSQNFPELGGNFAGLFSQLFYQQI